eukprot:tig00000448_g841.t1
MPQVSQPEFVLVKRSNSIIDPNTGSLFAPIPYTVAYDEDGGGAVYSYDSILKLYKYKLRAVDRQWAGACIHVDMMLWGDENQLMHEEVMLNEKKEGAFMLFRPPNERNGTPAHSFECVLDKYGETEQFSLLACSHTYRGQWFQLRITCQGMSPAGTIRIKTRTHAVKSKGGKAESDAAASENEGSVRGGALSAKMPKRRKVPAAVAETASGGSGPLPPPPPPPPRGRPRGARGGRAGLAAAAGGERAAHLAAPELYSGVAALEPVVWGDPARAAAAAAAAAAAGAGWPLLALPQIGSPETSVEEGGTPFISDHPTPSEGSVISPPVRALVSPGDLLPWLPHPHAELDVDAASLLADPLNPALPLPVPLPVPVPAFAGQEDLELPGVPFDLPPAVPAPFAPAAAPLPLVALPPQSEVLTLTAHGQRRSVLVSREELQEVAAPMPPPRAAAPPPLTRRFSGGTSVLSHLSWGEDVVETPHVATPLHSYVFKKFENIAELGGLHRALRHASRSGSASAHPASLSNSLPSRRGQQQHFLEVPGVKEEEGAVAEGGSGDPRREELRRGLAEAMADLDKLHLDDPAAASAPAPPPPPPRPSPPAAQRRAGGARGAPHAVLHPRTDIPAPFSMPPSSSGSSSCARVAEAEAAGDALTLASLLADPRILSTPLFRRRSGWLRTRRLLHIVRVASGGAGGKAVPPVSGVFLSLCAAVINSPASFASPELAERACENCWNLLTVFTSDYPLASVDLFDCGWNEAMRLLNRAAGIAAEACKAWAASSEAAALAGVLVVRSGARLALTLRQFGKQEEALSVLFEAWSTLLRLRVGPNRLEGEILRDLAECHVALGKLEMAEHFASRMYWFQENDDDRLFQATCIQAQGYIAFNQKRPKRAAALYTAACELAEALPADDYRRMYTHRLYWSRALALAASGKIVGAHKAFRRAASLQRRHLDINSSDYDVVGWLGTAAVETNRLADVTRHVYVFSVLMRTMEARAEEPRTAHAMFHVGNFYALDGKWKKALQHYAKAEALYRDSPALAACFSPAHTRRRRLLQAIAEVRHLAAGSAGPAAVAPAGSEEALADAAAAASAAALAFAAPQPQPQPQSQPGRTARTPALHLAGHNSSSGSVDYSIRGESAISSLPSLAPEAGHASPFIPGPIVIA